MGTAVRHSSSLLASAWPTPPSGESLPPPAPTVSTAAAMHGAPGPSSVAQSTTTGGNPTEGQNTAGVASPSSNPNSAGLSASMFSAVQNMTIHGGSYNLYVYPPHEGGSPNVAYAHPWVDSNDAVVTKPSLIVSDELLGINTLIPRYSRLMGMIMNRSWILRNRSLQRFVPWPSRRSEKAAPRLRYPSRARDLHPAAIG